MSHIENPFLIYGYEGPEYFCDRKNETEEMISALKNGCNLTLLSPRRYGKTGLIHNVFHHLKEINPDVRCLYMDIYSTKSLSDFVSMFGKTVLGKLDTPTQKIESLVGKLFRSSQITMTPNILTGLPEMGLSFKPQDSQKTLKEIFDYIKESDKECYIAIDEFQQISEYPETNVEEILRTFVQQSHNAHFIFSGSKLHMMSEMFDSPRHPFYRCTQRLYLPLLDEHLYWEFAQEKLKDKNVVLTEDAFHELYTLVDGVTWYIQAVLNRLYRLSDIVVDMQVCRQAIQRIIQAEEEGYKRQIHSLTAVQSRLLYAIAAEGTVPEPLSGKFVHEHQMKSPSSVQRALDYLTKEEYVYQTDNGYIVYDRFLGMWLGGRI